MCDMEKDINYLFSSLNVQRGAHIRMARKNTAHVQPTAQNIGAPPVSALHHVECKTGTGRPWPGGGDTKLLRAFPF